MLGLKIKSKVLKELSWEQKISLLLTIFSAIVSLIIASIFGPGKTTYYTLVIGTTLVVLTDRIGRYYFENKAIRKLNEMRHHLHEDSLECKGGIGQGLDWLIDNIDGATRVLNTVFSRSDTELAVADRPKLKELEQAIQHALTRGCVWDDIYLPHEVDTITNFAQTLKKEQIINYRPFLLNSGIPMMQYTVITYRNRDRAVIFGWSFQGGNDDDAKVFVSRGKETAAFFADHYQMLRAQCVRQPLRNVAYIQPSSSPGQPSPQP